MRTLMLFLLAASPVMAGEKGVIVDALVTGYCPCRKCCGKFSDGKTSRGRNAQLPGCAVDPKRIRYGSFVEIPAVKGFPKMKLLADDTGGAMRRSKVVHVDVRFKTHATALRWGRRRLKIRIIPPSPKKGK